MATKNILQSLQKFFGIGGDATTTTTILNPVQSHALPPSEFLAFVSLIKSELQKLHSGRKSLIIDLKALEGHFITDLIILCEYTRNILVGNPIDDSLMELEKIVTILYTLPSDGHLYALISKIFLGGLWKHLPHPPVSFSNQAGYQWRSADGFNNNLAFPNVGQSGQKYAQTYRSKRPQTHALSDPGLIFDELLKRRPGKNGEFRQNESHISSNLFYFATLITHDLFNTDERDRSVTIVTSYADLSPLYGWIKETQDSVRTGKDGLLKPDQFADTRFWLQPAGVTALVVLFNRNHNYLAEKLLQIDENSRFSCLSEKERDEALFQTARLINERTYASIILFDYLRVILGMNRIESSSTFQLTRDFSDVGSGGDIPRATGNQCSLEFNFLYRWHQATSIEDEIWLENRLTQLIGDWENLDVKTMFRKLAEVKQDQKQNPQLKRDENGCFNDKDLAKALIDGCNHVSGAFGGQNTPASLRNIEISGILHARKMGLCTLNEYRSFLNLKKYGSFEEFNPELADRLAKIYKTIADVEFYPGLLCERRKPAVLGSGLCLNYTTSFAIMLDAVALSRGDRFHSQEATHYNLTNFGMEDSQSVATIDYGTLIGRKLISRHLNSVFPPNSVYAIFPFMLPNETRKNLGEKHTNYDFIRPF